MRSIERGGGTAYFRSSTAYMVASWERKHGEIGRNGRRLSTDPMKDLIASLVI